MRSLLGDEHGAGGVDGAGVTDDAGTAARGWVPGSLQVGRTESTAPGPGVVRTAPRWRPDRRALLALAGVVSVVATVTVWWVLSSRPSEVAVRAVSGTAARPAPGAAFGTALATPSSPRPSPTASAPATPADLVVDVAGQVAHPGVYRLAAGSRVVDALRAAGGALPGVATVSLNLAALLRDGQQVAVGVPAAVDADPVQAGSSSRGSGPVNLNTASIDQLQELPGVGPVLAQHILDWRGEHGHFASVDQLNEVSGIGTVKFAELRTRVTV